MSRLTLLGPDLEARVGNLREVVEQLVNTTAVLDGQGTLPPPFMCLTPHLIGHGQTWWHPQVNVYIMRSEHRPILLTSEQCATCTLRHVDIGRIYILMSPTDLDDRVYARYVPGHVGFEQPNVNQDRA